MKNAFYAAMAGIGLSMAVGTAQAENLVTPEQVETAETVHLDVFKDPNCGCCKAWIDHVEQHQFTASVHHPFNLASLKSNKGIGLQYRSCHTAVSATGYVFEGHIPGKLIQTFLANPPEGAIGLSVPGMPVGSPGMEYQNKFQPYPVLLLKADGSAEEFAMINSPEEQY